MVFRVSVQFPLSVQSRVQVEIFHLYTGHTLDIYAPEFFFLFC